MLAAVAELRVGVSAIWLSGLVAICGGQTPKQQSDDYAASPEIGGYLGVISDLQEPAGVAIGADEHIYIAEAMGDRVRVFDRSGKQVGVIGGSGTAPGEFTRPLGIAVAADGSLYVADTGNHRVQQFDANGKPVAAWGKYGLGDGQFCQPHAVAVDAERVYVADTGNERVQVFDRAGKHLLSFGTFGSGDRQFKHVVGVTADAVGNIYTIDNVNHRIQKFDATGKALKTWGDWGQYKGLLAAPESIFHAAGKLYVTDTNNHRVQVFDLDGNVVYEWGMHVLRPHEGEGRIHYPNRVAVSPDGMFAVVCEGFENRAQMFGRKTPETQAFQLDPAIWRSTSAAHFGRRLDIDDSYMIIGEPDNHSIVVYDLRPEVPIAINQFGTRGSRFGQFADLAGMAIDATRKLIYLADNGNQRLQIFGLQHNLDEPLRFLPQMTKFVRSVDLAAMTRALPDGAATWTISADAIRCDGEGRVHLVDARHCRIFVLDGDLNYARSWGSHGTSPGQFRRPTDIAFSRDGSRVYVVDADNHRVQAFDRDGKAFSAWGTHGDGPGEFRYPYGITASIDGFVYVTDEGAHRVQKFTEAGEFVAQWGTQGISMLEFYKPCGIRQETTGRLTILDFGNHRGETLSPEGDYLDVFGSRLYIRPAKRAKMLQGAEKEEPATAP